MGAIVEWIEANPTTAALLSGVLGSFLGSFFPAMFRAIGRFLSRFRPPLKMRHRDHFAWFSLFDNDSHTHIVLLYSVEIVNAGDRLISVKDIRARYKLASGGMSPEILPTTLPRPPSIDVGNEHAKVFPVFFTQFPTMEAYGANITQSGDIAPSQTQAGFLLFIEDIDEIGRPEVVNDTLQVEISAYPEGMARVSCTGACAKLTNSRLEEVVPGLTEYQAHRRNLGAVTRFRSSS